MVLLPSNFLTVVETWKQGNAGLLEPKRYATYLRPESIDALQRYAFERRHKDYEVVQPAIDEYLERRGIRLPMG
jgi:hypothetical protein